MLTQAAALRANVIETPEGEENQIRISYNGETFGVDNIKWVMDYINPVGRPCPEGCLRQAKESDFRKIIDENIECRVQKNERNEYILHYIQKPE